MDVMLLSDAVPHISCRRGEKGTHHHARKTSLSPIPIPLELAILTFSAFWTVSTALLGMHPDVPGYWASDDVKTAPPAVASFVPVKASEAQTHSSALFASFVAHAGFGTWSLQNAAAVHVGTVVAVDAGQSL